MDPGHSEGMALPCYIEVSLQDQSKEDDVWGQRHQPGVPYGGRRGNGRRKPGEIISSSRDSLERNKGWLERDLVSGSVQKERRQEACRK